jgi:hypothetical protein
MQSGLVSELDPLITTRRPVLLPGAATDAAGTFDDAIADDRNRSLADDHVAALRHDNPARGWLVGALRHLAARRPNAAEATALPWLA